MAATGRKRFSHKEHKITKEKMVNVVLQRGLCMTAFATDAAGI